jgi:serine/threonine protein kinase
MGSPSTLTAMKHRLTVPERVSLFPQVCETVEYAQRTKIVHRDLKPGNIFVNRDGTAKLLISAPPNYLRSSTF